MSPSPRFDPELERHVASRLMDFLVRVALVVALAVLCYRALSPFLYLLIWSVILAVMLYPLHQFVAGRLGGRQGLASTLLVLLAVVLVVAPSSVLVASMGDSAHRFVQDVQSNSLEVPAPSPAVAGWPIAGG